MFTMREMAEGGKMVVPHGQPIRMRQTRASEQAQRLDTQSPAREYGHSPVQGPSGYELRSTRRVSPAHRRDAGHCSYLWHVPVMTSRGVFLAYGHPVGSQCKHRLKGPTR